MPGSVQHESGGFDATCALDRHLAWWPDVRAQQLPSPNEAAASRSHSVDTDPDFPIPRSTSRQTVERIDAPERPRAESRRCAPSGAAARGAPKLSNGKRPARLSQGSPGVPPVLPAAKRSAAACGDRPEGSQRRIRLPPAGARRFSLQRRTAASTAVGRFETGCASCAGRQPVAPGSD